MPDAELRSVRPLVPIRRLRPTGVCPVELGELPVEGHSLAERLSPERIAELRRSGLSELDIARCLARPLAHVLNELRGRGQLEPGPAPSFDLVYLTGAPCRPSRLRAALRAEGLGCRVVFGPVERFPSEAALRSLLAEHGASSGMLACVCESQLEVAVLDEWGLRHWLRERDLDRLPPTPHQQGIDQRRACELGNRALDYVSAGILDALDVCERPLPLLVLSLPCELDDRGVPGACSYPGWAGDSTLVRRLVQRLCRGVPAGFPRPIGEVLLLSGAELAALSVRAALTASDLDSASVLVLTLGLGPTAARLEPVRTA